MNMTLKFQAMICAVVIFAGFIASLYLETDIFYNLAWALTGLIFFINPVYPESITCLEGKKARRGIRIAAAIIILIGYTHGFGV